MATTVRGLLLGTTHVERGSIQWWGAARTMLVVSVLVLICVLTGHPSASLPLAVGGLFGGLADAGEVVGRRWRTILWATFWFMIATGLGGLGSNSIWIGLLFTIIVSLVAGMAGALGARAALVGVLALVSFVIFEGAPLSDRTIAQDVLSMGIGGVCIMVVTVIPHLFDPRIWHRRDAPVATVRERLRGQFTLRNDYVRHAVRLTVIMSLAVYVSDLTTFPHDYWVPMTIAWVAKPDRDGTATRIVARISGTIAGVLLAALLIEPLDTDQPIIAIVVGCAAGLAVGFVLANYAVAVIGVTMLVVGLFTFDGDPVGQTIVLRIILTCIAGVMAFLASYLWPPYRPATAAA